MLSSYATICSVTLKKKSNHWYGWHDARSKCSTGSVSSATAAGSAVGTCSSSMQSPSNSVVVTL